MNGLDMDTDVVTKAADGISRAGRLAVDAWNFGRVTIGQGPNAIGPPDRLASAFYSGYTRREEPLVELGNALPAKFEERAGAARESVELYQAADARSAEYFPR